MRHNSILDTDFIFPQNEKIEKIYFKTVNFFINYLNDVIDVQCNNLIHLYYY